MPPSTLIIPKVLVTVVTARTTRDQISTTRSLGQQMTDGETLEFLPHIGFSMLDWWFCLYIWPEKPVDKREFLILYKNHEMTKLSENHIAPKKVYQDAFFLSSF